MSESRGKTVSASYFVFYQGTTKDPAAFLDHYKTHHARLLMAFPGLERLVIHEETDWKDAQQVSNGSFLLIAEMTFPDTKTLETAISSKERELARDDFNNFPAWDGRIWHQAMSRNEFR